MSKRKFDEEFIVVDGMSLMHRKTLVEKLMDKATRVGDVVNSLNVNTLDDADTVVDDKS